jgi:hypothetical protein
MPERDGTQDAAAIKIQQELLRVQTDTANACNATVRAIKDQQVPNTVKVYGSPDPVMAMVNVGDSHFGVVLS